MYIVTVSIYRRMTTVIHGVQTPSISGSVITNNSNDVVSIERSVSRLYANSALAYATVTIERMG